MNAIDASEEAQNEITVTGYKLLDEDTSGTTNLPLPIEKVPQSISLVNNDFLKAADLKTIGEVAQYTPGAVFAGDKNPTGSEVKLRGFSAGYAINGLPLGQTLMEPDSAVIDRLEIVKGPSSVVYGASRPGGTVNVVQKSPSNTLSSYVLATVGSWGRRRLEGQITGPLNSSGTVRGITVAAHEEGDSFIHHVDLNKTVGFVGIDADLTPSLRAYVRASYQELTRTPYEGVVTFADGTLPVGTKVSDFIGRTDIKFKLKSAEVNGGLSWAASDDLSLDLKANFQDARRYGGNGYVYGLQPDGEMATRTDTYIGWPVKDFNIGLSSTYKLAGLGLADSFLATSVRYQTYHETYNGRGAIGSVNLFAGEDVITDYFNHMDDPTDGFIGYSEQKIEYLTASAQADIKIIPAVSVLAGASFSEPKIKTRSSAAAAFTHFNPDGEWSLRGGLNVEPVAGLNLYASYSESFQPQDRVDINDNVLPPLSGKQKELGVKFITPDRRLLLTASAFELTQSNQQTFDQIGGDGLSKYRAIGKVRHKGIELEASGEITSGWQVKTGFTYIDAKIVRDSDPALVGMTRKFLPKTTASIFTSYDLLSALTASVGARYSAKQTTSYDGSSVPLASYVLVDAGVVYTFDKLRLQLNLKNIFNERYYTAAYDTIYYGIRPGEPRSFSVTARYDF